MYVEGYEDSSGKKSQKQGTAFSERQGMMACNNNRGGWTKSCDLVYRNFFS